MSYLIPGVILVGLVILAAPISLRYNTGEPRLQVKWLGLSMTIRLAGRKPMIRWQTLTGQRQTPGAAVLRRFWRQRELCRELINRVWRFVREVFRTLDFRDSEASLSLPDPLWNSLLYAVVTNIRLDNVDLSVNFERRNYAKIRVTVFPFRVAGKLAALLVRLPYIRIVKFAWELKKLP